MQMSEFFKKIEIIILFFTLHFTCVHIFAAIRLFAAEILRGGHNAPPPPALLRLQIARPY